MPRHNRHKGKRTAAARRKNRGASFEGEDGGGGLPRFVDGTADEHYYFDASDPFAHGSFGDAFFAVRAARRVPLSYSLRVAAPAACRARRVPHSLRLGHMRCGGLCVQVRKDGSETEPCVVKNVAVTKPGDITSIRLEVQAMQLIKSAVRHHHHHNHRHHHHHLWTAVVLAPTSHSPALSPCSLASVVVIHSCRRPSDSTW